MAKAWFAVRCILRMDGLAEVEGTDESILYEERVTLWRAESVDAAVTLAEDEAREYAAVLPPAEYLGLAQSYELADTPGHGAEVFSLVRESQLLATPYLDTFFDTGTERQTHFPS